MLRIGQGILAKIPALWRILSWSYLCIVQFFQMREFIVELMQFRVTWEDCSAVVTDLFVFVFDPERMLRRVLVDSVGIRMTDC